MAYDAALEKVVMHGGDVGINDFSADTWVWDGADWTQKHPANNPPPRAFPAMTYDAAHGQVVLFGGESRYTDPKGDTWVWPGDSVSPTATKLVYYALGDSIASGHGLPGGTGRTPDTCRVSPNAYPSLVFEALKAQLPLPQYSVSFMPTPGPCSGAKSFTSKTPRPPPLTDLPQQVAAVLPFPSGQTTLVSLSVGADNFNFEEEVGDPVHICLPDDQFMQWVNDTIAGPSNAPSEGVQPSLTHWLRELLKDDHTFVVLTDYFNPFNTASHYFKLWRFEGQLGLGACAALSDDVLWKRVERVIYELNAAIASAALEAGTRVRVARLYEAFSIHRSAMPDCGDSPPDASTTFIQYPSFNIGSAVDDVRFLADLCFLEPLTCLQDALGAWLLKNWLDAQLHVGDDCLHPNADGAAAYAGGEAGLGPGVFDAAIQLLSGATSPSSAVAPETVAHVGFRPLSTTAVGTSGVSSAACCTTHGDPGCSDASCQSCVCAADGFCCNVGWDSFCTNEAATTCESACQCPEPSPTNTPGPTPTPGGACCAGHGSAGCDDATCETCVCALDSDCCNNTWDGLCAARAEMQCAPSCLCPTPVPADTSTPTVTATPSATGTPPTSTPSPTPGGDCCALHAGPNCGDSTCAACVCAADGFCCGTLWDQSCADRAAGACDPDCACATPTPTVTPPCLLDVYGSGPLPQVSTDIVYISRVLLGLPPVPASFRVLDPTIPPDATIAANVTAIGTGLDVDGSGQPPDVATDIVYIARLLLGLPAVPASFRVLDPSIPPDATIAANTDALCP